MTKEYTPTPWSFDKYNSVCDQYGKFVSANGFASVMSYGDDQKVAKANAAHIVKCVNMHDELVVARLNHVIGLAYYTLKKAGAL